jgi:hypothetical protein
MNSDSLKCARSDSNASVSFSASTKADKKVLYIKRFYMHSGNRALYSWLLHFHRPAQGAQKGLKPALFNIT